MDVTIKQSVEEHVFGMVHHRKKKCSSEGCSNQAISGGVCIKHGAVVTSIRKTCSVEGCTTKIRSHGVCTKHGKLVLAYSFPLHVYI